MKYEKRDCQCPRAKHRHGTRGAYQADRCRCLPCRAANANGRTTYSHGGTFHEGYRVSNLGTQRRLRALFATGYPWTVIGERLGLRDQSVREIAGLSKQHPWEFCYTQTADAVAALYAELRDGMPEGTAALRARLKAQRYGWMPCSAWSDDDLDEPTGRPSYIVENPRNYPAWVRVEMAKDLMALGDPYTVAAKKSGVSHGKLKAVIDSENDEMFEDGEGALPECA